MLRAVGAVRLEQARALRIRGAREHARHAWVAEVAEQQVCPGNDRIVLAAMLLLSRSDAYRAPHAIPGRVSQTARTVQMRGERPEYFFTRRFLSSFGTESP